jgi:hypothetical protein
MIAAVYGGKSTDPEAPMRDHFLTWFAELSGSVILRLRNQRFGLKLRAALRNGGGLKMKNPLDTFMPVMLTGKERTHVLRVRGSACRLRFPVGQDDRHRTDA